MKTCPRCGSQYTDDTLQFCLQDGTPLTAVREAETPTVVLGVTETFVRQSPEVETSTRFGAGGMQSQVTRVSAAPKRGGGVVMYVAIAGVLFIAVLAVLGIGGYMLLRRDRQTANLPPANNSNSVIASPSTTPARPSPSATATPSRSTPTVNPTPVDTPPVGGDQARAEVLQRVDSWRSALEARDFNGYMSNYADTVDYYRRRGIGIAAIRADKARAFQLFNSMQVQISNESTSVSPSGDNATVTFDKEWHFTGRSRSDGKTRSQLEFSRINGRWLITAERDLQLYYKQ